MLIFRKMLTTFSKTRGRTLFWFTTLFFLFSSSFIHSIEPEKFPTIFDGFWWTVVTATTVGYGDYFPVTTIGRIYGIIVILTGLLLIGAVITRITEKLTLLKRLKEEGKLSYKGTHHYLLIGWNSHKTRNTIEEILSSNPANEVVLIDTLDKSPFEHDRFHYVQGDPTDYLTLEKANAAACECVVIFAPDNVSEPILADGYTLIIATTIESFAETSGANIYTIAEILKEHHQKNFKHAKVDEFILSQQSVSHLLAKSCLQKGSSQLFLNLLSKEGDGDLYKIDKKEHWVTYQDAFEEMLQIGAILVSDGKDTSIARRKSDEIPPYAQLFVICDNETYTKILHS